MAFVKLVKNNAHFKRYQTKYRRRREGKTDYRARKRLIAQDKNKFNTPKYRMIVRTSNRYVTCQIAYSTIKGDMIFSQAHSKELLKYGMPVNSGLKNWTACYATGLLLARRTLKKLGLDEIYQGKSEDLGEDYMPEDVEDKPRTFKVCLDVGLATTSTGARVFGALKGALDGGLFIPHKSRRWPCAEKESFDAELVRSYVFGGQVAQFMNDLVSNDKEMLNSQFAKLVEHFGEKDEGDEYDEEIEEMWTGVYEKIRENPEQVKTKKMTGQTRKSKKPKKLVAAQRKNRVAQKIEAFTNKMANA